MNQSPDMVKPIGVVRSAIKEVTDDCWGRSSHDSAGFAAFWSGIHAGTGSVLAPRGDFSAEQNSGKSVEKGARHPRGHSDWPKMGIFAQRPKDRPNRIGITICKGLFVQGLEIRVRELEAVDDTPVLDVKPYLKGFAPRRSTRTGWG